MSELVFFLEEPSAQAMLEGLLPRLLPPSMTVRYVVFEGKQNLERELVKRLRGYRTPQARFVVLCDKDASDCRVIKAKLVELCRASGRTGVLVRIACHELESWYLADLRAVEVALELRHLAAKQHKAKYRTPDELANAAEELEKLTEFAYQKIAGSQAIGSHLEINNTRSRSFAAFIAGLKRLLTSNETTP